MTWDFHNDNLVTEQWLHAQSGVLRGVFEVVRRVVRTHHSKHQAALHPGRRLKHWVARRKAS